MWWEAVSSKKAGAFMGEKGPRLISTSGKGGGTWRKGGKRGGGVPHGFRNFRIGHGGFCSLQGWKQEKGENWVWGGLGVA